MNPHTVSSCDLAVTTKSNWPYDRILLPPSKVRNAGDQTRSIGKFTGGPTIRSSAYLSEEIWSARLLMFLSSKQRTNRLKPGRSKICCSLLHTSMSRWHRIQGRGDNHSQMFHRRMRYSLHCTCDSSSSQRYGTTKLSYRKTEKHPEK